MFFGKIELEKFDGLDSMPQGAASAWTALNGLVGVKYKPLLFVGTQQAHGVNYFFIAEQTLLTRNADKRIVMLAINEYNGVYALIPHSIEVIVA